MNKIKQLAKVFADYKPKMNVGRYKHFFPGDSFRIICFFAGKVDKKSFSINLYYE